MIRTIRRFLARPEDLAQRTNMSEDVTSRRGLDPLAVLAPFADLITFLTAVWFETSADRAQMLGFAFAAVICLGSLMRARLRRALKWTIGRYGVVMVVILLAFFLRNGLFGLLTNVFDCRCWRPLDSRHRHGGPDARGTCVLRGRVEPATRRGQELEVWRACADAACVPTAIDLLQSNRAVTHGGVLLELFASP